MNYELSSIIEVKNVANNIYLKRKIYNTYYIKWYKSLIPYITTYYSTIYSKAQNIIKQDIKSPDFIIDELACEITYDLYRFYKFRHEDSDEELINDGCKSFQIMNEIYESDKYYDRWFTYVKSLRDDNLQISFIDLFNMALSFISNECITLKWQQETAYIITAQIIDIIIQ